MAYNLFLDDIRMPEDCFEYTHIPIYILIDDWVIVRNYSEFVKHIEENGPPEIISFDHDLADEHYNYQEHLEDSYAFMEEKTGFHCAKWLVEYCMDNDTPLPQCNVHSANTVGAENIRSYLESYRKSKKTS